MVNLRFWFTVTTLFVVSVSVRCQGGQKKALAARLIQKTIDKMTSKRNDDDFKRDTFAVRQSNQKHDKLTLGNDPKWFNYHSMSRGRDMEVPVLPDAINRQLSIPVAAYADHPLFHKLTGNQSSLKIDAKDAESNYRGREACRSIKSAVTDDERAVEQFNFDSPSLRPPSVFTSPCHSDEIDFKR